MKKEPFDLAKAKAGHPICDATGAPVRFLAHVPDAKDIQRRVIVFNVQSGEMAGFSESGFSSTGFTLFMRAPANRVLDNASYEAIYRQLRIARDAMSGNVNKYDGISAINEVQTILDLLPKGDE